MTKDNINLQEMISAEQVAGLDFAHAEAKVGIWLILKAISNSGLKNNVTIKGGVLMYFKTHNNRRATKDLDIDFIRYPIDNSAISKFVNSLNVLPGITFRQIGEPEVLNQHDYHGKRIFLQITDAANNTLNTKIDIGVHTKLSISQDDSIFDAPCDTVAVYLLANPNEQIFTEKLLSLLKHGIFSTRYKDIFDMYYLIQAATIDKTALRECLDLFIFSDPEMRENNISDILLRLTKIFSNTSYNRKIKSARDKWIDADVKAIESVIITFLQNI